MSSRKSLLASLAVCIGLIIGLSFVAGYLLLNRDRSKIRYDHDTIAQLVQKHLAKQSSIFPDHDPLLYRTRSNPTVRVPYPPVQAADLSWRFLSEAMNVILSEVIRQNVVFIDSLVDIFV